jgi:hypothetical protein
MPILVRTDSAEFARLLQDRYGSFVAGVGPSADASSAGPPLGHEGHPYSPGGATSSCEALVSRFQFPVSSFQLKVELVPPDIMSDAEDVGVRLEGGRWVMERGDFRAEWDPERRRGWVRQSPNPYSIDSVIRILHSLLLAREGGFLVHAASAIRNGRAFLFAGVSGAGKTTLCRMAPPDVVLLTDEISYVRPCNQGMGDRGQGTEQRKQGTGNREQRATWGALGNTRQRTDPAESAAPSLFSIPCSLFPAYEAFGTPFAGELERIGENLRAPVAALYLHAQGGENKFEAVSQVEAARALLQNVLFFAQDEELVRRVFQSVLDFVGRVPVRRLIFAPDARVWELIR